MKAKLLSFACFYLRIFRAKVVFTPYRVAGRNRPQRSATRLRLERTPPAATEEYLSPDHKLDQSPSKNGNHLPRINLNHDSALLY
jgi:hypothetical protein